MNIYVSLLSGNNFKLNIEICRIIDTQQVQFQEIDDRVKCIQILNCRNAKSHGCIGVVFITPGNAICIVSRGSHSCILS